LADYVEALEKRDSLICQGRKVHEVGNKQKGRKLQLLNKVVIPLLRIYFQFYRY
jgi:hypothetical protein